MSLCPFKYVTIILRSPRYVFGDFRKSYRLTIIRSFWICTSPIKKESLRTKTVRVPLLGLVCFFDQRVYINNGVMTIIPF